MMYISLKQSGFVIKHLGLMIILGIGLTACDINHAESKDHSSVSTTASKHENDAIKNNSAVTTLDAAAGRTFLPNNSQGHLQKLSASSLQYVGRYHTRISCTDAFADCENGEAEYILNLLADGSAYWNVVHYGRIGTKDGAKSAVVNQLCPNLTWKVDNVEHNLIIHCPASDVNFYFNIDSERILSVNLEKLFYSDYGKNREFLEQNYFVPTKAYILKKE